MLLFTDRDCTCDIAYQKCINIIFQGVPKTIMAISDTNTGPSEAPNGDGLRG